MKITPTLLITLVLLILPNVGHAQLTGYIDTTYDFLYIRPYRPYRVCHYPVRVPIVVHPTLPLHAVRKQQFMSQYNKQLYGLPHLIAFKQARRQARLIRINMGISPFTGEPK